MATFHIAASSETVRLHKWAALQWKQTGVHDGVEATVDFNNAARSDYRQKERVLVVRPDYVEIASTRQLAP